MLPVLKNAVLIVIDVQQAIDHPSWAQWGQRNNPQAEENIAQLLAAWRIAQYPIVHVRHVSTEPNSTYRPGQGGCEFKDIVKPLPGETVITKHVACAFIGTDLEQHLSERGLNTLVITGVTTNNSVEATARVAGNLGFNTYLVADATATFARVDFNGKLHKAEDVHALSLANMQGEYATVVSTQELLNRVKVA